MILAARRRLPSRAVLLDRSLEDLPPASAFDPSPELEQELRERLLQAGEARAGA